MDFQCKRFLETGGPAFKQAYGFFSGCFKTITESTMKECITAVNATECQEYPDECGYWATEEATFDCKIADLSCKSDCFLPYFGIVAGCIAGVAFLTVDGCYAYKRYQRSGYQALADTHENELNNVVVSS